MALAALIVRIGGDLTGLNKALTQADKDVQRVGKKLSALGSDLTKGLTVPIVAAGVALAAAAVHVGEYADRLLDLVDMTGLSTATLQEFRHVARVAGVETDTLAEAAIKLTTKLSSGGEQTKELTGALAKLGLKATDANGRLVSMDKLLPDIIGRLQGMRDVTTRNAIAADIFGKSWAELAPILGLGAGAMDRARKAAHDLGLVMSEEDLKAANDFRIKWDTLTASAGASARMIGMAVMPVMEKLVILLQKDVVPAVRSVVKWFDDLSPSTKTAIGVVAGLVAAIGPLLVVLGTIMKFVPLIGVAFTALTGPIGLTVLAIGALTAAGILLVKNWDLVMLAFEIAWMGMKDAAFFAIGKIIDAVAGMAMAFKMTGLSGDLIKFSADLKVLAGKHLATAGEKIAALVLKMHSVATVTETAAGAVVSLGAALDKLPKWLPKIGLTPSGGGLVPLPPAALPDIGAAPGSGIGDKLGNAALSGLGNDAYQMVQGFATGLGPFAALLPIINGAMQNLAPVLEMLIEPLVEIGQVIGDALAPVLRMLVPVIQLVADIFIRQLAPVLKGITIALSIVMEGFGWLVRGIGRLVDALPGISAKGVINAGQAMIDNAQAARRNARATDGATDAVNSFASALSNIPRVLNINALRHMVTGQGGPVDGGGGGGHPPGRPRREREGATVNWNGDIVVPGAGDPVRVAEAVGQVVQRIASRGGRSRLSVAVAT